jgi:hypothetical protein
MVFILCAIGLLLAASSILVNLYIRRRSNRNPAEDAGGENFSSRVLWDISEGGRGPVIRNGHVSLDRRSFLQKATAAAMALVGVAVAGEAGRMAHGASMPSDASRDEMGHSDSPHYDQTGKHTDITAAGQHADGIPHSDRAHIDNP